ncbi:MAG TPA: GtrA family protein [Bacteroidales bacterium]|jgi:putative flippase GtrA|nr:GtrA family protein [Bacteroidales bacterium]MDI9574202.1 GtrA family protein [Bacteroidota bacterium]OQC61722.1 MAG: GtrA-like protein [Bacteroidetes bacterium ADurb.Bin012]MBP9511361.1 GtrA family protein [Bacteroidales bacterium]MBP9589316.1 GtrA family protein [Bacteroidales bacterium]
MIEIFNKALISRFIKFIIVGFSGLIVDYGITAFSKEILKIQRFISNAMGFICAASSNYYLNRIWTFSSTNPEVVREFGFFFVISLIGLGINSLILWFVLKKFKLNFYLAKIFAIAGATLWNFFANAFITFQMPI